MAGNVFTYEDAETRERKSGIFYEVKEGTYMINLTNDSKYAGVRMEFTTSVKNGIEVAQNKVESSYKNEVSWKNDKQNLKDEVAEEKDYWAEQDQGSRGNLGVRAAGRSPIWVQLSIVISRGSFLKSDPKKSAKNPRRDCCKERNGKIVVKPDRNHFKSAANEGQKKGQRKCESVHSPECQRENPQ